MLTLSSTIFHKSFLVIIISLITLVLSHCSTRNEFPVLGKGALTYKHPDIKARNAIISRENYPRGVFIGRRYMIEEACFWGYLRRPTQPWQQSLLVAMNELDLQTPDRIPFGTTLNDKQYGYDQNYEYLIEGSYTGNYIYDSKIGVKVLEFKPTKFTLLNKKADWLFHPEESYNSQKHTLIP